MTEAAACFCVGPPGDCPCVRRARETAAMYGQFNTALWLRDLSKPRIRVKAGSRRMTPEDYELYDGICG